MRFVKVCSIVLVAIMFLTGATACGGLKPPSEQKATAQPTAPAGQPATVAPTPTTAAQKAAPAPSPTVANLPTPTPQAEPSGEEETPEEIVAPELSDKIKSYRQDTQWLTLEGEDQNGGNVKIEWVREGPARRMVISGYDKDGKTSEMELIEIADAKYMRVDNQWMSISGGQEPPTGEEMLVWTDPNTWKDEPACEYKGRETHEGQKTKKWSCTQEIFATSAPIPNGQVEEGSVESWVSEEYDIPVHTIVEWRGKDADGKTYAFRFESKVYDINEPIKIAPPEGVELPGLPEDIPMMEGATEVFAMGEMVSYKVKASVDDAVSFYTKGMADNGWKAGEPSGVPGMTIFTKGNRQAQIMVNEEDATTVSVTVVLQGE